MKSSTPSTTGRSYSPVSATAPSLAFNLLLVIILALCCPFVTEAASFEGRIRVTFRDSARSRNVPITISYASDLESGDNKPLVGTSTNTIPDFSVVVMGHGFQLPVTVYRWLASAIIREFPGTIVILPETGAELFPNHADFAADMVACARYIQSEGRRPGSIWYEHVRNDVLMAGHSMGGGCAILAAKTITQSGGMNVRGLITFAPAETNPSSTAAAAAVTCPSLILAGSQDCVTPLQSTTQPIYNALASQCKALAVIPGASHCQFADSSFVCSLGELNCRASISRTSQQDRAFGVLRKFLGRSDLFAAAADSIQIQTTMSFLNGTELPADTVRACEGDTVTFRCATPGPFYLWLPDSSRGQTYRTAVRRGLNPVTLVTTQCFGQSRITRFTQSLPPPTVSLRGNTSICNGDSTVLIAERSANTSLVWSTGDTTQSIVVRKPGVYTCTVSSSCGTVKDSLRVVTQSSQQLRLQSQGDTLFCDGIGSVSVACPFDSARYSSILWNNGEVAPRLTLKRSGSYTLHATLYAKGEGCDAASDTIRLTIRDVFPREPVVTRRADSLWCTPADSYTWFKNSVVIDKWNEQYYVVTQPGDYRVRTTSKEYHDCPALSTTFTVTSITDVEEAEGAGPYISVKGDILRVHAAREGGIYRVFTSLGERVTTGEMKSSDTDIDVSHLPCGSYLVHVDGLGTYRLVICR